MGIIWRSAMPLLTTLAALVIIVHSAEEDLETEYRHDLRPRILDTGTPNFDQPWRAMEADLPVQERRNTENWGKHSPDDVPKRRRPGRKRKRRPQTNSDEDLIPQERFVYPDEPPQPFFDLNFENTHQTTEMPKRRRKKPESRPIRWTDDVVDLERPIRRRGQRRKRPSLETWPELSEFKHTTQEPVEAKTEPIDQVNIEERDPQLYENKHELTTEQRPTNLKLDLHQRATNVEYPVQIDDPEINVEPKKVAMVEDESLSESSSEVIKTAARKLSNNNHNHNTSQNAELNKAQDKTLAQYHSKTVKIGDSTTTRSNNNIYNNNTSAVNAELNKAQDKTLAQYHCKTKNTVKVGNPTTPRTSLALKNEKQEHRNTSKAPVRRTLEQEKAYEKIKESLSVKKIFAFKNNRAKLLLGKCKDKLQRLRTRSLQGLPPTLWMDEIITDGYLMDPLTLKDILKRSNGTSLSEILQQHNLSLTDLLHGKHHAVSIFKHHDSLEDKNRNPSEPRNDISEIRQDLQDKESDEQAFFNIETNYATEPAVEYPTPIEIQTEANIKDDVPTTTAKPVENTPKISTRRRFPLGARKKLRMRPMLNNTYKGQLSRDLVTLNSRKYSHHRRNITKSKEWRDVIPFPSMMQNNTRVETNNTSEIETTTTAIIPEETTITVEIANNNTSSEEILEDSKLDDINMDMTETAVISIKEILTENPKPATEKPTVISMVRPTMNSSGLRRQAFNNRLKRKRLKNKNATTEAPQDDLIKHLLGLGGLVSSSEFIARTQEPKSVEDDANDPTTLEDFITTESTRRTESVPEQSTAKFLKFVTTLPSTTEETAQIEIEEILNDTRTSAKLSKILMERNMTLSELVEHRERGSSHVHLADIFHNASREPNPAEPFLSKSLLEPISKETYPLRALLDANLHDPRVTTDEPSMINNVNIPIVMDFRNNVNENAENMGIMSLFNNFTKPANETTLMKDSEGRAYKTTILAVNITNKNNASETVRESRVLSGESRVLSGESRVLSETPDDVVSWNEIFSLMGRNHNNDTSNNIEGLHMKPYKTIRLDEDADGDGLIVLEDLQHLKEFENNIASGSEEKIEVNTYENKESTPASGILDKIPSQTKSVTVATASIAGLAMILFLLTYAAFKWKQQRSVIRKKRSFGDERIPTPVFENRKGHKNNCSTRSISPMLQTSNIYTLNTLDSQNGKDSPDYMWDSLRKPFQ